MKYTHLRDYRANTPAQVSIASFLDDDRVYYGVAYCSKKDQFKKSRGREISKNRLTKENNYIDLADWEITHKSIMVAILTDILDSHEYPASVKHLINDHIDYYLTSDHIAQGDIFK